MKNLAATVLLLVLVSCTDNKNKSVKTEETASQAIEKTVAKNKWEAKVPSYNFDELNTFLTKENDTTYVINFWATWCKPCIKELPAFEKLNADYSDEKLKVILVSLDFPDKIEKQVIPFIEKNNIKSQVVLLNDDDSNTWIPKVSKDWSGAIPATIIYSNTARKFYERSFTYEELVDEIKIIM